MLGLSLPMVAAAALALPNDTTAQEEPQSQASTPELPRVVVSAGLRRSELKQAPAAVSVLQAAAIQDSGPGLQWSESLPRLPGLWVADRGNAAQDLQFSVRGFGARASFGVRGLRMVVDGIPATASDGSGALSGIGLEPVQQVEWLRGPFSALHGAHSGGTLAIQTRAPRSGPPQGFGQGWAAGAGQRAGAALVEGGELHSAWRLAASHWDTDGWRPHAQARRTLLQARWDAWPGWSLNAQAQSQPAQDPLGLSRSQWAITPYSSAEEAARFNTRKTLQHQALGLRGHWGDWQLRAWAQQRQVWQWQAIAPQVQAAPSHPGGVIALQRAHQGLHLQREQPQWVAGLSLEQQHDQRQGFENFVGPPSAPTLGVTGRLRRDETQTLQVAQAFAQGQHALGPGLTAHAGLSLALQRLSSVDAYLANGDDGGQQQRPLWLPTVGLQGQAAHGHSWFVNLGAARETPTLNELAYRSDGSAGLNSALRPQQSLQAEWGWRHHAAASAPGRQALQWELTAFTARTQDEIVSVRQSGGRTAFGNAGRTGRVGLEAQAQAESPSGALLALAWTWLHAEVKQAYAVCERAPCTAPAGTAAPNTVAAGSRLPGVPEHSLRLDWRAAPLPLPDWARAAAGHTQWGLSLSARSRIWVNDRNTDAAPGHSLLALWWRWQAPQGHTLTLRLDNALQRRHVAGVIVNESNQRHFEPGPPRSLSLQWRHAFGGGG
jgi:iron complex outermembrane receptor protein